MKTGMVVSLLAGVSIAAIATASNAQEANKKSTSETVAEVVVTASKRSERLQDVPIAVSVVGEERLNQQNITSAADLSRAAPAITAGVDQIRVRGIGTFSFARSSEASVGVVLDGVALANAGPVSPQLFDVARVEVLAGPQGTLFGRNASAGLINIVTNAPDPTAASGNAHVDVGERNFRTARVVGNLPVSDNAALRVTGSFVRQPQVLKNVINDEWNRQEAVNGRARFLWKPSDAISVNIIGDYTRAFQKAGGWAVYKSTPGSGLTQQLTACGVTPSLDNYKSCATGGSYDTSKVWGYSGQVDWDLGQLTLVAQTAYRGYDGKSGGDADSSPRNILDINGGSRKIRNFSQELRLVSPGGQRFDFVAGLYFFNSEQDYTGDQAGTLGLVPPPLVLGQTFATNARSRSYAAFSQATWNVSEDFRLVGGLRLNRDEVVAATTRRVHPGALSAFGSLLPVSATAKDDSISYRIGAQYDVAEHSMAYLTYNRGYKGPAINDQAPSIALPLLVRPEVPKAWELGLKSEILDRRVAVNIAAFHTKVIDFQTQYYDPAIPGYVFGNAPSLTTKGVQVELFGRITPDLDVNLGAIYTDATYGKGYLVSCSQTQTAAQGCFAVTGGTAQDASGTRLSGTPKFKLSGNTEYRWPLGDRYEGYVQADFVYTTKIYYGQGFDPYNSTGEHTVVGARIGARTVDGRLGASIFVRNLFDERAPSLTYAQPLASQQAEPLAFVQFFGPESFRFVGASLDVRF